jgi:lysophospholipase L1-like esterase
MKANFSILLLLPVFAAAVLLSGCSDKITSPTLTGSPSANAGNFSNVVFVGDSLSAGFQSGTLMDSFQPNGWNVLLATQAGFKIEQPLIAYPGVPAALQLTAITPTPVVSSVAGTSPGRDNLTIQPTDIAVPGATLYDLLYTQPLLVPQTGQQIMNYLVLGFPGIDEGVEFSQIQWAHQLNPTTLFVWIGNNDALIADETGKPANMTPVATFTAEYQQMMSLITANTRANVVLMNIPDVTTVPYMTSGALLLAEYSAATSIPQATLSTILGVQATDLVNPTGMAEISQILAGTRTTPIGDEGSLTAAEIATVQSTVNQYNAVIAAQATANVAQLVDIHAALLALKTSPPTINSVQTSMGFLGGIFSLDGIHPTNTGYAIIANAVITQLDKTVALGGLGLSIPQVNVSTIAAADPLFPPNLKLNVLAGQHHITAEAGQRISWLLNPQKQLHGVEFIR